LDLLLSAKGRPRRAGLSLLAADQPLAVVVDFSKRALALITIAGVVHFF